MFRSVHRKYNLLIILYFHADSQQIGCHDGIEDLVGVDNTDNNSAPTTDPREDRDLNSNREINIPRNVLQTKIGNFVQGSSNKDNGDRVPDRHVRSPWGPPRYSRNSSPPVDSDVNVYFYSLFHFLIWTSVSLFEVFPSPFFEDCTQKWNIGKIN